MTAPKLRFKEFDGNWDIYALEDQIDFLAGYAFDSKLMSNDIQKYQLIKMSNVYQNQLDLTRNSSYWEKIDKKTEKFLLKKGDIVLTLTGTVGKTDYGYNVEIKENDKFLLNQRLVRLRGKIDFSLSKFVQYRISTDKFFYHFFNSSKGGTGNQSNVSIEDLKLLELSFPSKAEQTKIATFLSAVDEKISQLSQKLHLLGQYKQGMMQKLFSQQIRFKVDDGSEFGEWKSIQLKDIAERITRKNKEENQNALTISAQMGLVNQQEYFSKQIASRDLSKYYLLHKGEYAYNKSYSAGYPMGAIKRLKLYDKGVVSTLYICFSLNKHINSDFFEQYVESGALVPELEKIAQEGARNHGLLNISLQEFFEVNLWTPCLEEQTKIANFLSSIDKKIDVISEQLEQAKLWKKGLLQQMFV